MPKGRRSQSEQPKQAQWLQQQELLQHQQQLQQPRFSSMNLYHLQSRFYQQYLEQARLLRSDNVHLSDDDFGALTMMKKQETRDDGRPKMQRATGKVVKHSKKRKETGFDPSSPSKSSPGTTTTTTGSSGRSPYSVLIGRTKEARHWPGNRHLEMLCRAKLEDYSNARSKVEKSEIVSSIKSAILQKGGTFYKATETLTTTAKDGSGDGSAQHRWCEIDNQGIREKIGSLLRDLLSHKYSSSSKSKTSKRREQRKSQKKKNLELQEQLQQQRQRVQQHQQQQQQKLRGQVECITACQNLLAESGFESRGGISPFPRLPSGVNASTIVAAAIAEQHVENDDDDDDRSVMSDFQFSRDDNAGVDHEGGGDDPVGHFMDDLF